MATAGSGSGTNAGSPVREVAHDIAAYALGASWAGLPHAVRREAVRAHLNWVGCALGGARTDTAGAAVRAIQRMGGHGTTPLLGRAETLDMVNAAMVNCLTSAAWAFDDTHLGTITHPTGPVAAGVWAASEQLARQGRAVSGAELLLALALGIEFECRLSNAVVGDAAAGADLGWYMTGVSGGVGTAVAVGRLLGLDHDRMVAAIGLAAAQACGVRATHGSMATAYVPAVACRNGLTAAFMAAEAFTCSAGVIDGRNGLLQVMAPGAGAERIRDGLGQRFEILHNAYKPYPCGIVIHPTIDACLDFVARPGFHPDRVERLDVRVHPDALNLTWRKLPSDVLGAQVSIYHWAAASLVCGRAQIEQAGLPYIEDAAVRAMQERIFPVADTALASDQADATLTLKEGTVLQARVDHAVGSVDNPMTDAQLADKFISMASPVLGALRARELLARCQTLEQAPDALPVFRHGVA